MPSPLRTRRLPVALLVSLAAFVALAPARAQTVTVTTAADVVDINATSGTVADLPGPDGRVSFSEALIATNNTPGHQTIGFAIPQAEWTLQFVLPGRAVLTSVTGFYFRAFDAVTIDGTTQTAFTGDTNPNGNEVAIYGLTLYLIAGGCTLQGFDSTNVDVSGSGSLVEGNTGSMNITVFGGSGSLIQGNQGGTIKLDRSSDNVVVGNVVQRVRVLGGGPPAANNRIGGPLPGDRNLIVGYGSYNSEGLPSGTAVQLFDTQGTVVENNWIGTADGLTQGNLACTIGIGLETVNSDVLIKDNLVSGILGHGMGPHHAGQLFGRALLVSGNGDGLTIVGNVIGLDIAGEPLLGSVTGIDLGDPVTHPLGMTGVVVGGALPGEGNVVAGHIFNGITVGRSTAAVRLAGNAIHDNGWLGIDLVPTGFGYGVTPNDALDADTGGNGLQNHPVLDAVLRVGETLQVAGSLHSSPGDDFTLEFFASPECDPSGYGEGQVPLGTAAVSTDDKGDAAFAVSLPGPVPEGWFVTATATLEPIGATSEFSACAATAWRDLGGGTSGSAGVPWLVGEGSLAGGTPFALTLADAPPGALLLLWIATTSSPLAALGGTVHAFPFSEQLLLAADGTGGFTGSALWPAGLPAGTQAWFQVLVQDPSVVHGITLSNGLLATTP